MSERTFFCPECGTKLSGNARFCPECGNKVDIPEEVPQVDPTEREYSEVKERLQLCSDADEMQMLLQRLEALGGYKDAAQLLETGRRQYTALKYAAACQAMDAGKGSYDRMAEAFAELGSYKDAAVRCEQCKALAQQQKEKKKKIGIIAGAAVLAVCLIALLLFMFVKPAASKEVDQMIADIGTVTLDKAEAVIAAEYAVAELTDRERKHLDNLPVLEDARSQINQLCAEDIDRLIGEIGTVTLDSGEAIRIARDAYDCQDERIHELVTKYDVLLAAEEELLELQAGEVEQLISAIGTVTLKSDNKIDKAWEAYNGLSDAAKEKVSNKDVLEAAEDIYDGLVKAEEEKKAKAAIAKLKKKKDDVEGITWYEHPRMPYYADTRSYFLPYIGKQNSSVWLRLRMHYTNDDWIFWDSVTISVDGEKYYKTYSYFDITRDNGGGDVWEWMDIAPTEADIEMLFAIADSKKTIVRFQGDDYHYDMTISSADKQAIKEVLIAYNYMR